MKGMLAIPLAVLHEFKLFLRSLAVFRGRVIAALALGAGEGDYLDGLFLGGHIRSFRGAGQAGTGMYRTLEPVNAKRRRSEIGQKALERRR
jgi:hypothetical protein